MRFRVTELTRRAFANLAPLPIYRLAEVIGQLRASLAVTIAKGASSSASFVARATLAAVAVVDRRTAAAVNVRATLAAVAAKSAFVVPAFAVRATLGATPVKGAVATAPFSAPVTLSISRRAVDSQRALSNGDRRVTSDGSVRVAHQYA